jgi:hypothetical protein
MNYFINSTGCWFWVLGRRPRAIDRALSLDPPRVIKGNLLAKNRANDVSAHLSEGRAIRPSSFQTRARDAGRRPSPTARESWQRNVQMTSSPPAEAPIPTNRKRHHWPPTGPSNTVTIPGLANPTAWVAMSAKSTQSIIAGSACHRLTQLVSVSSNIKSISESDSKSLRRSRRTVAGPLATKNVNSFWPTFGKGDVQIQPCRCSCRRKRAACSQQLARILLEPDPNRTRIVRAGSSALRTVPHSSTAVIGLSPLSLWRKCECA